MHPVGGILGGRVGVATCVGGREGGGESLLVGGRRGLLVVRMAMREWRGSGVLGFVPA